MDALALLTLQIEWGADEALDDAPVDRLRPAPSARPAALPSPVTPPQLPARSSEPVSAPIPLVTPGTAAERAIAAAGAAHDIDALGAAIAGFDDCALRDTATKPVLPQGDLSAGLLLIGDPPGADEDRSGTPFAGQDGALLDSMLASIGLSRDRLLLAHLIPWRPPGGRPPSPGELTVCLPFLHRLITLSDPRRILLLGPLAVRMLLGGKRHRPGAGWTTLGVSGLSGTVPALVLPSPQAIRTTPGVRREAWTELRRLRRALEEDRSIVTDV